MERRPQENALFFFAILWVLSAWRLVTVFPDSVIAMLIAAFLAWIGIGTLNATHARLQAVRQPVGADWVPPMWLICWVFLYLGAGLFGTPHVCLVNDRNVSYYLGWNGNVAMPMVRCDLVRFLPLDHYSPPQKAKRSASKPQKSGQNLKSGTPLVYN